MSDTAYMTLSIRCITVPREIEWLAEHVTDVEWPKSQRREDLTRGCMFWADKFHKGVTQEFDPTLFRAEFREAWEQMKHVVNDALSDGIDGVLLVSQEEK